MLRSLKSSPTASESVMCGQLQGALRTVPPVPLELALALLHTPLRASLHTARVRKVGLENQFIF